MENIKQIIILTAAGLIILVLAYFAFFAGSSPNTDKPNSGSGGVTPTPIQVFSPNKPPNTRAVTLPTNNGNITVNNFFTLQSSVDSLGREVVVLHESPEYTLSYVYAGNYFYLYLPTPSEATRQAAERTLLATLQINQLDACKLTLLWKIGGPKGETYPSNLALSFCPGGLPLE